MAALIVKFTHDRHGKGIAVVSDLPGQDADLTPAQLRSLAKALYLIASDCESSFSTREKDLGYVW